jgi:uncharacterized protein Yka (UPF0111/DUF47 family)
MAMTVEQQVDLLADCMEQLEATFNVRISALASRVKALEQEIDELKGYVGYYADVRCREDWLKR